MYSYEKKYSDLGYLHIAGTDEVGRGPLAGPVVAAAVILDPLYKIEGLDDSKKLSEKRLRALNKEIIMHAISYSFTYIFPDEIDRINIYQASKKAMIISVQKLSVKADFILSDAMPLDEQNVPFESIIKGDSKSASIAAASIIAKVERDNYMIKMGEKYPNYGFEKHKGYPTKVHKEALKKYGILDFHRRSYKPVSDIINEQKKFNI